MRRYVSSLMIPLLLVAFATATVRADDDGDGDDAETLDAVHEAVEKGVLKPLPELKKIIKARFPGDIVRISPHRKHGTFAYEFKVLQPDGRLVEIEMDAATGRILETENE
ncbi:PepSY domain-containing protein [Gellertiella hungarica]|uniref:Putative membrane protein YkoI n=1 Tax=Gellertiella hungarica TaxID=1572859 RepID=A0A7W6NJ16_9HYPH|nr:PepSY domain-containing protein [Gellertiella hungarica]MBB4063293.1 putative membrane protein YkoI [Gellertiella hungarica]